MSGGARRAGAAASFATARLAAREQPVLRVRRPGADTAREQLHPERHHPRVALELGRQEGIACVETGVLDTELARADEAFLTGTSDEITPVVRIDGRVVGDGKPGPITRRLADAFRRATRG